MQEGTESILTAERIITGFSDIAWGTPLLVLLLGGGLFFMVYSRMLPFRYFRHAVAILAGKYDNPDEHEKRHGGYLSAGT